MKDIISKIKDGAPLVMGVVNVTPDSFSDGGEFYTSEMAIAHGLSLLDEGADILDIGGESTRPGADIMSVEEELNRVIPVLEGLKDKAQFISIDTRNAATMKSAIEAGANIVNDVSALTHDKKSVEVISASGMPVCLMHMRGKPQTMQSQPQYEDVVAEILSYLQERIEFCIKNRISADRIIIDPGIGFGKTVEHNLSLLHNINKFQSLGCPVMLGVSRKSFIGSIAGENDPQNRLSGSIAAALFGVERGVQIVRVHDVKETKQALAVYQAISSAF